MIANRSAGGYNYATQGYVATAVDILNNTNIGATATGGSTAGVTVTDKSSGTGVDFNFTIPPGADGVTPTIAVTTAQGTAGGDASVSASTSGTTTTLAFTIPPGADGTDGTSGGSILDADGNLGLGVTPDAKLHVNGKTLLGSVNPNTIYTDSNTDALLTLGGAHNAEYNTGNQIKLLIAGGNNDGSSPYDILSVDENDYEQFFVKGATSENGGSGIMYMKGKIGIGETSPDEKLHVSGNGKITGTLEVGGNVGIGTDTPLGKVHISGGGGDCVVVIQADTNNSGESDNPTLLFIQDGAYRTSEIGNDTNNGMVYRSYGDQIWYSSSVHSNTSNTALKDNQTERMRIKNNGNVGINTTSPGYKLDVNGTARVAGQMAWTGTGSTSYANYGGNRDWYIRSGSSSGKVILQDTGGNVGVGRSPSMRLDVAGTLRCEEMFFGNYDDTYNPSSLSCTKTRRSTGDPQIQFTINGVTGLGWIPFTFSLFGSGVNSNGGGHFHRATNGHGRFYNSSNSTTGTSGVTFTAINTSGNKAILTWTMDDVGRTYSVFSVTLNCYTGVIS